MKRIKRLEGWQGLWKGRRLVADQFCSTKNNASRNVSHPDVLYSPFCAFNRFRWGIRNQRTEKRVQRTRSWRRFVRMSRARSFYSFSVYLQFRSNARHRMAIFTILLTIVSLPMTILINRYVFFFFGLLCLGSTVLRLSELSYSAIITPYKLPNSVKGSLRILLTPLELAKPYTLYLTPGLLATTLTHVVCATLLARTTRIFFLGVSSVTNDETVGNIAWWRWILYLAWQCLSTLWFTPLEVIATRLSVQPNNSGDALSIEEEAPPEGISFCGAGEDVIGLRPSTEPYLGMVDCAKKIIEEEGWASLYRGFLFTMLGSVFGSTM